MVLIFVARITPEAGHIAAEWRPGRTKPSITSDGQSPPCSLGSLPALLASAELVRRHADLQKDIYTVRDVSQHSSQADVTEHEGQG